MDTPLGSPWVLYMNHSFSKSLSLHIILVLKLCCEDSSMGGFCQDASFGYLLKFHIQRSSIPYDFFSLISYKWNLNGCSLLDILEFKISIQPSNGTVSCTFYNNRCSNYGLTICICNNTLHTLSCWTTFVPATSIPIVAWTNPVLREPSNSIILTFYEVFNIDINSNSND